MIHEKDIPSQIQQVVDRVYRHGDRAHLRSRQVYSKEWLPLVREAVRPNVVRDRTDFNYGTAHVFDIALTTNAQALVARNDVIRSLLEEAGEIELITLEISVLAPFFYLTFARKSIEDDEIRSYFSSIAISHAQQSLAMSLAGLMKSHGFERLTPEIAEAIVPDVETELKERGTATIRDLIIGE